MSMSYFSWLVGKIDDGMNAGHYRRLLAKLYETPYYSTTIEGDVHRANDGISLRNAYEYETHEACDKVGEPCSMLELMVSLSSKLEGIMSTDDVDRTARWFWGMIFSLDLHSFYDEAYDVDGVESRIFRFQNRQYQPSGKGGLFTVKAGPDMRTLDLWGQMNLYINELLED